MLWFWLDTINTVLALGGLGLLGATLFLFVDYYVYGSRFYTRYVHTFAWPLIIATTIGSVALTLLYSEYYGFVPCSLCWLQRIALYPQALFALMAVRTKEAVFFPLYSISLSLFGLLVAIYHYLYQMVPTESVGGLMPCLADGTADCASKIINEFGFVTFPMLSAITFAFLIVLYLNLRRSAK